MPPHVEIGFSEIEAQTWIDNFRAIDCADGDGDGFVPVEELPRLLEAVSEKPTARKIAQCVAAVDVHNRKVLGFLPLSNWVANIRLRRSAKGRKRCIDDRLPLPPCCVNAACCTRMVPRDRAKAAEDEHDVTRGIMYTLFCRYDDDNSGEVEHREVMLLLTDNKVECDPDEIRLTFKTFDTDGSGTLNFDEFCELMFDLKAEASIVQARKSSMEIPEDLESQFSPNDLTAMQHHFGLFDINGSFVSCLAIAGAASLLVLYKIFSTDVAPQVMAPSTRTSSRMCSMGSEKRSRRSKSRQLCSRWIAITRIQLNSASLLSLWTR